MVELNPRGHDPGHQPHQARPGPAGRGAQDARGGPGVRGRRHPARSRLQGARPGRLRHRRLRPADLPRRAATASTASTRRRWRSSSCPSPEPWDATTSTCACGAWTRQMVAPRQGVCLWPWLTCGTFRPGGPLSRTPSVEVSVPRRPDCTSGLERSRSVRRCSTSRCRGGRRTGGVAQPAMTVVQVMRVTWQADDRFDIRSTGPNTADGRRQPRARSAAGDVGRATPTELFVRRLWPAPAVGQFYARRYLCWRVGTTSTRPAARRDRTYLSARAPSPPGSPRSTWRSTCPATFRTTDAPGCWPRPRTARSTTRSRTPRTSRSRWRRRARALGTSHEQTGHPRRRDGRDHGRQQAAPPAGPKRVADHRRRPRRRAPLPAGLPVRAVRHLRPRAGRARSRHALPRRRRRLRRRPRSTGSTPTTNVVLLDGWPPAALRPAGHRHRARRPRPDQTPGMLGPEWRRSIFDFYTLEGAEALAEALRGFDGGTARRARHRDADQVPGRAAGVHLPRRGVAAASAGSATGSSSSTSRRSTAAFTKPVAAAHLGGDARRAQDPRRDRLHGRARSTRSGRCWSPTTSARCPSTCW